MDPSREPESRPPDPPAASPLPRDPESAAAASDTPGRHVEPDPNHCELCGFPLRLERHCKIICPNCGFTRDCSDP